MKELRIKDICDKGSSNLKQKDVEGKNGQYPVYGASGIISHIDTYHQEGNYIAVVKDGSGIGRVTFMPAKSSVIGTMQYILPKEGFNINYIGYCLQSLDLSKYKQGAAIPHIYFRDYGERIVKVTENINEQQSIVDYLDSAFAKIDAMRANAEKALNEAKALFQASLKEMLEPKEGWDSIKLGDFAYMKAGDFVKASDIYQNYAEGLYPCYGGNGFRGYVNEPNQEGDFCLIGRQGALCGCVNRAKGIFRTTEHAVIVKPYQDIPTSLVYYMLINLNLNKYATGAAQPGLSVKNIAEQVIIRVPPRNAHFTIAATLDSLKSKVDRLQENYEKISQECDALKQAILRQVFE